MSATTVKIRRRCLGVVKKLGVYDANRSGVKNTVKAMIYCCIYLSINH